MEVEEEETDPLVPKGQPDQGVGTSSSLPNTTPRHLEGRPSEEERRLIAVADTTQEASTSSTPAAAAPAGDAAITWESVQIPRQFVSRPSSSIKEMYMSKYLKLKANDDATNPTELEPLWSLMTDIWNIKVPSVVFSVTGGVIPDKYFEVIKTVTTAIGKITSQTECWFISDGLNYGTSKYLSKELQSKGPKDNKRKSPVFVCATHWDSLHRKQLLYGDNSQYFYSMEYKLFHENNRILNPYQAVYLLLDTNGLPEAGKCVLNFRCEFEQFIKDKCSEKFNQPEGSNKRNLETSLPIVTLVIGGDDQTLDQVLYSVKEKQPVLVINNSGPIPAVLSELFYALEDVHPRTPNEAGWTKLEAFTSYMKHEKTLSLILNCFPGRVAHDVTVQELENIKETIRKIMEGRYYITVIDSSFEDEESLHCSILQGIYKGYSKTERLTIALKAGTHDFIEALFLRDVDPLFTEELYITAETLTGFHQENLNSQRPISKVLEFMCKEEFIIVNPDQSSILPVADQSSILPVADQSSILPVVGRILHLLLGPRYRVMYQKNLYPEFSGNEDATTPANTNESNESKKNKNKNKKKKKQKKKKKNDTTSADTKEYVKFKDIEEQMWHLFLLSILSAKPDMTQFFLMQTSAPLGASLLAFKMYSRLAFYSSKVCEEELRVKLTSAADHFQKVAIELLDSMYNTDEDEAYRVLVSELPFDLCPYVTPLLVADDSEAKDFMVQPCCQTYLQKVWKGNMAVDTPVWKSLLFLAPFFVIPWISFDGSPLKQLKKNKREMEEKKKMEKMEKREMEEEERKKKMTAEQIAKEEEKKKKKMERPKEEKRKKREKEKREKKENIASEEEEENMERPFSKLQSYYTAPVTKFHVWMLFYMGFLGLLSYYVLTDLKPFTSIADITVYEWVLIFWEVTLIVEEIVQLATIPVVRLKFNTDDVKLSSTLWYYHTRLRANRLVYAIKLYVDSGRWNSVDMAMILLFIASFTLRFLLPLETFQMVRIIFAVTIIVCYFRLLRYLSVLESLGPRIIAIQMMLTELLKFLVVLVLFVVSFGIAFQAILNPNQSPSWRTFADILYRTYWEMFGELFLEDHMAEMGRPVGEASCQAMAIEQSLYGNGTDIICYEWAPPVLLAIYLLISSVLLLNLLVAIFGMAYENIATMSDKVSRYNRYSLIQEFFHLVSLPPPLNFVAQVCRLIIFIVRLCKGKKRHETENCFRLSPLPPNHELQKEATKDVPSYHELQLKTDEALGRNIVTETSEKKTSKPNLDDLIEALTNDRVIEALTKRIVEGIAHNREG